jgi:hypothetical protein
VRLAELASTIRSKNAGVDHITFDSGCLSPDSVAELYGVDKERVTSFVVFEPAQAIKFTIRRRRPAGSAGEPDSFGSQCYPPLFEVDIP